MTTVADDAKASDRLHPRQWMGERAERISATGTMAIVLVAEMVFFSLRAPDFLTRANFPAATVQVSVLAVVSVGMTFGAISGALDISIASTMALAGCALSRVAASGRPGWEAVAVALLIGLTVGLVNGVVVVFGRVNPIVATLGMLGIARGLACLYRETFSLFHAHFSSRWQ
jgi:ribose/xylose/arabinose/galactoside ABC-type transport system permease subunit